jgi:hypothetical protein
MNHDQNKKTLRQFQCRDYLWEIFEQMSAELECSVDYLINEAMRQYARSRNYGVRTPGPGAARPPQATPGAAPSRPGGQPSIPSAPPPPPASGGYGQGGYGGGGYPPPPGAGPAPSPPSYGAPGGGGYPPPPRPSSYPPPPPTQRPPSYGAPQPQAPAYQAPPPQPQGFGGPPGPGAPPPLPGGGPAPAPGAAPGGMPPLFVIFNGQKFPVAKEEFIIGRGTKTADLPIKDGNISRRHAAVIWQNGAWYVKDLGSTNGIEFQGRKIDSKRVEEGDVYQLCDYEIRFTYR